VDDVPRPFGWAEADMLDVAEVAVGCPLRELDELGLERAAV